MNAAMPPDVWARIAGLRPRLRSHLHWHRHYYRGHPWCVLQDTSSGQHYYFSDNARRLLCLLDGRITLDQVRVALLEEENLTGSQVDRALGIDTEAQPGESTPTDSPEAAV